MKKEDIALIIKADKGNTEVYVKPEDPKKGFSLKELQAIVGGSIEIVKCKDGKLMVINEEGKLDGLPVNRKATGLYIYGSLDPEAWDKGTGDQIVGDVLVATSNLIK